ncbi:MAG TPA: tyrosine-protein phosphatase [Gemmatimonadaceae bacterium]|nr:tyrosine-protein phosphatase [Gemmatimonadaceae bacterium]
MSDLQDDTPPHRPRWRRTIKRAGLAVLVPVLALGSYLGALQLNGNIHAVQAGQLYRSAQLDSSQFVRVIGEDGIKSILNLRGAPQHAARWYDTEVRVASRLGVAHYDYGISAERPVTPEQIAAILEILRTAPRPILVHCQGGADRSGLVSALYDAAIAGERPDRAARQLSLRYGHFPYLGSKTIAMDRSFWAYVNRK